MAVQDRLLSEVERQQKYLAKLPADFKFPLFNARVALESQRASGYRNTAAASREIIDNAFEAGADWVHVAFESARSGGRNQRIVTNVAFIDNGAGMLSSMARYALSWGGGTHFDDPNLIGRFGFGLPNSSINQTRRVEVYTRTDPEQAFTRAYLDIREFSEFGLQEIPEVEEAELPAFVQAYLDRKNLSLDHGTVVVWANPDRLTYKRPTALKEHMLDDFGATYRYILRSEDKPDGLDLVVEGTSVLPVDPLFTLPSGRYYVSGDEGGAILMQDRFLPVVYYEDRGTGERHLRDATEDDLRERSPDEGQPEVGAEGGERERQLAIGVVNVRIVRLPIGFADDKAGDEAKSRFEIRKSRRGMSFVRAGREIQTIDSFPRSARDVSSGMGRWPLLQSYAYHWGVEVRFQPELDDVFGITNDKQAVRPIEDFWRVLAEKEIDTAVREENTWQSQQRRKKPEPTPTEGPSAAERAAHNADVAAGVALRVPRFFQSEARKALEVEVSRRTGDGATSVEEARKALEQESKIRPYRIEYFEAQYGPFYEPRWIGTQIVVRINTQHPFYTTLYGDLLRLAGGSRAKEGVDVLLIALAKAELTAESDELALFYQAQRSKVWSPFLETAMKSLGQKLETPEEQAQEDAAEDDSAAADAA
jgi:Histidine kinase-, DNA gyrase B-, and HSP90-like ATPase